MARTSRRQYYQDLRQRVIKKWAAGMSERKIGRHLDMPRASVQTIIRLQMKHGHVNLKPHPSLAAVTSVTIAVSDLIRDRIHEAGLDGTSARKKPYLNPNHRRKRFAYANKFKNQTAGFWKRVLFTDEAARHIWPSVCLAETSRGLRRQMYQAYIQV
ncbi:hypothetical protein PC119_g13963 [Phytophthora cactorum]|uniref:Transposase Tc1-like domain-containing protein n=1 Tax=Phytophthora cactorum TaxID=29920 RepID=A0A8T1CNI6_9STRA|nr:hypothetical protein PC117_g15279 [Phytophthora cactorum]KAG3009213.1 hypothetical protein PC119_g13963 [Phytophthora cactorum]